ncbi:hypothetical protein GQ42DRAFT_164969 [Ramicandelaber brevisporus]|nr:hypothetical protein GQ42DRAFT_164969 [Ramicandelaber brevisporus]
MKWFPSLLFFACASTLVMSAEKCDDLTCTERKEDIDDANEIVTNKYNSCMKSKNAHIRLLDQKTINSIKATCKTYYECCKSATDETGKACQDCPACKEVPDCCKKDNDGKYDCTIQD